MSDQREADGGTHVTISGPVSGQVSVGRGNVQTQTSSASAPAMAEADRSALEALVAALRAQVEAQAPAEQRDAALEKVAELSGAVSAEKPDQTTVTTLAYVRNWFAKHLPALAGSVVSVIVHPVVGKLVEAAGEAVAAEFRRQFGPQQ